MNARRRMFAVSIALDAVAGWPIHGHAAPSDQAPPTAAYPDAPATVPPEPQHPGPPAPTYHGGYAPQAPAIRNNRPLPSLVVAPPAPGPDERVDEEAHWYGYQTLLVDAAMLPAMIVPPAALGIYGFGAPVVHVVHGRYGVALGSLGLRVGLPVLGGLATWKMANCEGDLCGLAALPGALFGAASAIAIDASALAWEREEAEEPSDSVSAVSVSAAVDPRGSGGSVSVAGRF